MFFYPAGTALSALRINDLFTGGMAMKYRYVLFALGAMAAAGAVLAANRPGGYTTICNEGQSCAVPPSTNVAFGRADQFLYKVLSGSFACTEATFGGRIGGGVNECSVPTGTVPTDPPPGGGDPTPALG